MQRSTTLAASTRGGQKNLANGLRQVHRLSSASPLGKKVIRKPIKTKIQPHHTDALLKSPQIIKAVKKIESTGGGNRQTRIVNTTQTRWSPRLVELSKKSRRQL
jgi:hypothetical protein